MSSRKIPTLLLLAFAVSSATAQGYLATKGQVVLADGDAVPSIPGAVIGGSSAVDNPVIDLDGNLLLRARMAATGGVTIPNDRLLLYGRTANDLVVVARSGSPEPTGTIPGATLDWLSGTTGFAGIGSGVRISPQGGILLWASKFQGGSVITTGTGATGRNDSAIFWGPVGGQSILARRGDLTPGGGGSFLNTEFSGLSAQQTSMNAAGTVCFQATLEGGDVVGTTNNAAWLIGTPNNLQIMQRKGDVVAVPGGNAAIGTLGFNVQMNDAGMVLHDEKFSTTLGTAPATAATDGVLMLFTPAQGNQVLVREGDAAPGTAGAAYNVLQMATVGLTRTGRIGFTSSLIGGDTVTGTGGNDQAAYIGDLGGNVSMVLRKGDALPGGAQGETIASINNSSYTISDTGYVTFFASVAGPNVTTANDGAVFGGSPGNLVMLAREGDAAPGVAGFTFQALQFGSNHLNDRGQVIFNSSLTDGAATPVVLRANYGYTPGEGLKLIFLENEQFTTQNGLQTAYAIGGVQSNSGDGGPLCFNNNGDFVYRASFLTNGTGAAIRGHLGGLQASPASIPASGGTQTFELDAGVANAGRLYVLAGTLSGTRPGFGFGGAIIPLNQDSWFQLSLQAANGSVYTNSWGLLDANGKASASFNFPAGFGWFSGAMFHHAFVALDLNTVQPTYVSQPTSVKLY